MRSLVTLVIVTLAVNLALSYSVNTHRPDLRDAEYGQRLRNYRNWKSRNPDQPVIVALGSSRTAMGIRPESSASGPQLFNFARMGAGHLMELMTYRRLRAEGLRPSAVLVEYWPALNRGGSFSEIGRINPAFLGPADRDFVDSYFPDPGPVRSLMRQNDLLALSAVRTPLLRRTAPRWLPATQRHEPFVNGLSPFGWVPSFPGRPSEESLAAMKSDYARFYGPIFKHFAFDNRALAALHELLHLCWEDGAMAIFVRMPEGPSFRSLVTPEANQADEAWMNMLRREWSVPVLDYRTFSTESDIPEGLHLLPDAATRLTEQLTADVLCLLMPDREARP